MFKMMDKKPTIETTGSTLIKNADTFSSIVTSGWKMWYPKNIYAHMLRVFPYGFTNFNIKVKTLIVLKSIW